MAIALPFPGGYGLFINVFPMMKKMLAAAAVVLALGAACNKTKDPEADYASLQKLTYEFDGDEILNPERGFFVHVEFNSKSRNNLSASTLQTQRTMKRSLIYTIYYMEDFMECPIPDDYLQFIEKNFSALRDAGMKCVLRFAYKRSWTEKDHPWDPTVDVVMNHVAQLKPLLQANSDVIFCLEAGFVGVYGEWYYTDHFVYRPKTADDYKSRKELLTTLLDVMPKDRQVLVRYPAAKMTMYGLTVADSLTEQTAHKGDALSRIGHHNDCYVSSANDVGTYNNSQERDYVYHETRYTIWGGETCAVTAYCNCEYAVERSEQHHMTYLNSSYHTGVISRWREQQCLDEITRRMGYRLALENAWVDKKAEAGKDYRIVLKINNSGFAAPMNPRGFEYVFKGEGGVFTLVPGDVDPRFWFENLTTTVDRTVTLPADMPAGEYNLYLNLPDPRPSLHDRAEYAIRLSNKDSWEEATGYNYLTTVSVQ